MDVYFDHEALRLFIEDQMEQRKLSGREFATLIGVSQPTIQRALDYRNPNRPVPSMEFLMKLSDGTGVPLRALITRFVRGADTTDGRAEILMAQIAQLPEAEQAIAITVLRALLLQASQKK